MPFFTFITTTSLALAAAAAAATDNGTCYRRDGTEWTSELSSRLGTSDVFPCDPDAPVTHCCRAEDYCLSNGLCINAEDDNWYTIQGCTAQVWEGPCVNEFQNDDGSEQVVIHVWACEFKETKDVIYCLGESNCCSHDGAATVLLPRWTDVYHPKAAAVTGSDGAKTTSSTDDDDSDSASSSSSSSSDDNNTLKIALGVGIGVGACLIASVIFLALQVRRKSQSNSRLERALNAMGESRNGPPKPPTYDFQPPVELASPTAELSGTSSPKKSVKNFVEPVKGLLSSSSSPTLGKKS